MPSDTNLASGAAIGHDAHRAKVRRAYTLLVLAVLISAATLIGHYMQPMGSWWRDVDGELTYTGIRPPIWKTYHFPPLEIEAMGIVPDAESPGGEVFAIATGGSTLKLVDLNADSIPGFNDYATDVRRLAAALRDGNTAPPILWVHWTNVAVAVGTLVAVVLWLWSFVAIWKIRPEGTG